LYYGIKKPEEDHGEKLYALWFDEIGLKDDPLVAGKNASLVR